MSTFLKKKGKASKTASSTDPTFDPQSLYQRIAECAYELFLKRDQVHGHDLDDWLEAERMVLAKSQIPEKGRALTRRKRLLLSIV